MRIARQYARSERSPVRTRSPPPCSHHRRSRASAGRRALQTRRTTHTGSTRAPARDGCMRRCSCRKGVGRPGRRVVVRRADSASARRTISPSAARRTRRRPPYNRAVRSFPLAVLVVLALPLLASAAVDKGTFTPGAGGAGITLGMTRAQVISKLGKPLYANANGYMQYSSTESVRHLPRREQARAPDRHLGAGLLHRIRRVCAQAGGIAKLRARYGTRLRLTKLPETGEKEWILLGKRDGPAGVHVVLAREQDCGVCLHPGLHRLRQRALSRRAGSGGDRFQHALRDVEVRVDVLHVVVVLEPVDQPHDAASRPARPRSRPSSSAPSSSSADSIVIPAASTASRTRAELLRRGR